MNVEDEVRENINPEKRVITSRQVAYLAKQTSISKKKLTGKTIKEINKLLRWRIDPHLLLFKKVCGRVVKKDPESGEFHGVPNATVHIEDTDCSFLGLFPVESPFLWLLPIRCNREIIATVTTDACGEFCVYIPRWDIDRILRFRLERICFPEIIKPTLRDILVDDRIVREPPEVRWPRPEPDPSPIDLVKSVNLTKVREIVGNEIADQLEMLSERAEIGTDTRLIRNLLDSPMLTNISPPAIKTKKAADMPESFNAARRQMGMDDKQLEAINLRRMIGPFFRCRDIIVAEWVPFFDVPDITFRVTQDIDADGTEEEIYSEGFFDVRWNIDPVPYTVLEADAKAISSPNCDPIDEIDCVDEPAIVTNGYMPLTADYLDNTLGYGLRVNRPRPPDGLLSTPQSGEAQAPFCLSQNLHGCVRLQDATHYRLIHSFDGGSDQPFLGLKWWAPRLGPGAPIHIVPDTEGWYEILSASSLAHPNWLLHWPTGRFDNGRYVIKLQLGQQSGSTINIVDTSDPKTFTIDNTRPSLRFVEIRWRPASVVGDWNDTNSILLPAYCPVITKPLSQAIAIRVVWNAKAVHFRDARLTAHGCGAGGFTTPPANDTQHWYVNNGDNEVERSAVFELPAGRPAGCYSFVLNAWTRAMNSSGYDAGPALNWYVNQYLRWNRIRRSISLVNT